MQAISPHSLLSRVAAGDDRALARAITIIENALPGAFDMLAALSGTAERKVIGITGPPGAGKSTLVSSLLAAWTAAGKKVAVVATDPSSPFHRGALLGDRIRMERFYNHPDVYIRSMASRGALGGLHPRIMEVTDLLRHAPFDLIVVETVGVGQSEVEIAGLADCTAVVLVPEGGDAVQTLKAGLMEIADIFVINKDDRPGSDALHTALRTMTHERAGTNGEAETPIYRTAALNAKGIAELAAGIASALGTANDAQRKRQIQLLADKGWRWIGDRRMAGLSREDLCRRIAKAIVEPGFNLYKTASEFSARDAVA